MLTAYLCLGSNVGDREAYLKAAVRVLNAHHDVKIKALSGIYESEAEDKTDQRDFYNLVLEIETNLSPIELLGVCELVEKLLKRQRTVRWGPRTIDLDILLYNSQEIDLKELKVPHPRMLKRLFMLVPLLEVAPEAKLPGGELVRSYLDKLAEADYPARVGNLEI